MYDPINEVHPIIIFSLNLKDKNPVTPIDNIIKIIKKIYELKKILCKIKLHKNIIIQNPHQPPNIKIPIFVKEITAYPENPPNKIAKANKK